jgi:broad specificity phosphatase PhoE
VQVIERVSAVIARLSREHAGRDIIAVSHGGAIRAALATALDLDPERALAIATENCGLTRVDHIAGEAGSHAPGGDGVWRVALVNLPPKAMT